MRHGNVWNALLVLAFNSLWLSDAIRRHRSGVNISSGNGLMIDGTKPFPEPMPTSHQSSLVTFICGTFHKGYLSLKINYLKCDSNFRGPMCCGASPELIRDIKLVITLIVYGRAFNGARAPSQYKDGLCQYGDFHYKDYTVARPSYVYCVNSHTGKTSLYWDGPQINWKCYADFGVPS